MASTLKLSAKVKNGVTDVKSLVLHPMETGARIDADSGEKIPAHHITQLIFTHKDKEVMVANFSTAVSKNPFFGFSFEGAAKGDKIKARWVDNLGKSDELEAEIG
jgi:sulfur-oxidizing protein SoxZ